MAAEIEAPSPKQEQSVRQAGLSKWMEGLQKELPNPGLGAGTPEPIIAEETPVVETPEAPVVSAVPPVKPVVEVAKPVEQVTTDESRWPRSAKEWKNFTEKQKSKTDEYQKQITERDTRIKDLEAKTTQALTPEIQKEIDGLKKENEDFSRQLRLVAVTNHPRFKSYFESKTNSALGQLKSCIPADQIESVTKLIQQPDSDGKNESINALLEEMGPLQRGKFLGVITNLESIASERDGEIARAKQDYEQMVGQAKADQDQRRAGFSKLLDDTVKGMQDAKNGRPEYQMREGETEWNTSVERRLESGKKLITGNLPPDVMFKAAFDAAAYPDVLAGYRTALSEVDKLKKQIAAMTAANPKIESPKRAETATGAERALPKDARPMDYTQGWVKKFGEAMRGE